MNIQEIMKQAQVIQQKMTDMQEKLKDTTREGVAGGGLVKAVVNGKGELVKLDIAADILQPAEKAIVEDLIVAAFNDAKSKIEGDFSSAMSGLASEIGMPDGFSNPNA